MEFRKQLTWLMLIAALLPLIVIGTVVITRDYQNHRATIYKNIEANVSLKAGIANHLIADISEMADIFAHMPIIMDSLSEYDKTTTISSDRITKIRNLFCYTKDVKSPVTLVSVFDTSGTCLVSNNPLYEGTIIEQKANLSIAEEMKLAESKGVLFSEIITDNQYTRDKRMYYCVKPVLENRKALGYLAFLLSAESLMDVITMADSPRDNKTFIAVYDQYNRFINSNPPHYLMDLKNEVGLVDFKDTWEKIDFHEKPNGFFTFYNYTTGEHRLAFYCCIEGTEWKIVSSTSERQIVMSAVINAVYIFIFILVVAVLFFLIANRYANVFSNRLKKLIQQIETLKPLQRIDMNTKTHEVDKLITAFNKMLDKFDKQNTELVARAKYDQLTKLYNRTSFEETVRRLIKQYDPEKGPKKSYLVFLFVDIDDFKNFNSQYGHDFGDRIIRFIGGILLDAIYGHGYGCRFGGDEFVLCISDQNVITNLDTFIGNLTKRLSSELIVREGETLQIKCSIGLTRFPENGTSYEILIEKADQAIYNIKINSKNGMKESDEES